VNLEVVVVAVSDVDRAKSFYTALGWRLDADVVEEGSRLVQVTPPGSGCSVQFGEHLMVAPPGSAQNPDGNGWLVQEVTNRLPGRVNPGVTSYSSSSQLAIALRRAEAAHGEHEKRIGHADTDWPEWYAEYMVREQAGGELPT
jgi:catechol 2,3-dioxygenase-like lactoylglutathione lyase family enzyme